MRLFRRYLGFCAASSLALVVNVIGCGGGDTSSDAGDANQNGGSSSSSSSSSGGTGSSSGGIGSSSGGTGSSSGGTGSSSGGTGSSSGGTGSSSGGTGSSSGGTGSSSGGTGSGGTLDGGTDSTLGSDSMVNGDSPIGDSTGHGDSLLTGDAPDGGLGDAHGDSLEGDADTGASDAPTGGDGGDGSTSCGANNTQCTIGGSEGLCRAGACSRCTDRTDDDNCTTAYGSATKAYLCLAGVCTPGDCRNNGDCGGNPNGRLCGVSTPNLCGKCTKDQQCSGGAATPVCETSTGRCVAGACSIDAGVSLGGGAPAACPVNGSDICCTGTCQPGAGSTACCPGVNAATYCAATIGNSQATCANNVCTACPQVLGGTPNYLVDPNGGSDQTGSGDSTTAGCAFKTITRALQVIGRPVLATTITVLGPSTVLAGETFPIPLPANVTLTTKGGAVDVDVPLGSAGFALSGIDSAIDGAQLSGGGGPRLTISGQNGTATFGIVVDTGAGVTTANSPSVSNVVVTNFVDDGIVVENAGVLRIGAGVTSTLNGTTAVRKAGLHVTGTGQAIVQVASGAAPAHFDANTNHGILVDTGGSITVAGAVSNATTGVGTVTTNRNYLAGVWIQQTPGTPPLNSIDGLVSFGNTNGNGARIVAGSNVKMRNTVTLGNQQNGILVSGGAAGTSNDISKIDLGTPVDAGGTVGGNIFQEPLGSGNNGAVGICLEVAAGAGSLRAAGNIFGAIHCATTAGALTFNAGPCAACVTGVCDLGIVDVTGNDIDVSMCTP